MYTWRRELLLPAVKENKAVERMRSVPIRTSVTLCRLVHQKTDTGARESEEQRYDMKFDYMYAECSEQFAFYRIPKALFTDAFFSVLSTEAKVLYGLLLDRVSLSARNGWIDAEKRVFIIYTIEEIQEALGIGNKKSIRLLTELGKIGLIERKRQGLGRPNLIYVKNFMPTGITERHLQKCQSDISGSVTKTSAEMSIGHGIYTDTNHTNRSNTIHISSLSGCDDDAMRMQKDYESFFKKQIEYDRILSEYPYDKERLDEILGLLVDTCTSGVKTIRISGDTKPMAVVRSQLMKLNQFHIAYVMKCMSENDTKIRNIKQYLLAALYNAPLTMGHFYQSWVNNDMAEGRI